MTDQVVIYDDITGEALSVEHEPVEYLGDLGYEDPAILVDWPTPININEHYVDAWATRTLQARIAMTLTTTLTAVANGVATISISGIESGTIASASLPEGVSDGIITDGIVTATSKLPGGGVIKFEAPPMYLDETIEVTFT